MIAERYEVLRTLGEGASGRTLLCQDGESDRRVAVKELHFGRLDDWKQLELFEREAHVLARLDHPGIPKIFDSFRGEGEEATLYIVQEFVDGASLQERIDEGPMLGQQEVRDIALGLLDILDYLHGRVPPVMHRDIKPSNVLVRAEGHVSLVDFGGVWAGWRAPDQVGQTVLGTFGYMPPEQLLGQVAPTSDLYALGATLLHVATGKPPSDFPFDTGRIEVPDSLPIERSLARLIENLLEPAPRDRPQSAGDAREIALGNAASAPTVASTAIVPSRRPTSLAKVRGTAVPPGYGPRVVDIGPPPRDTKGEFRDVYRNLVNPLFPARRTWAIGSHIGWLAMATIGSVATLGLLPLGYYATVRQRSNMYRDLFERGEATPGVILSAEASSVFAVFRFEFEVDGEVFRGRMEYAQEMSQYWAEGEVVPVLYDPDDPTHCCFVYR